MGRDKQWYKMIKIPYISDFRERTRERREEMRERERERDEEMGS